VEVVAGLGGQIVGAQGFDPFGLEVNDAVLERLSTSRD
jgi:hypothetical protein